MFPFTCRQSNNINILAFVIKKCVSTFNFRVSVHDVALSVNVALGSKDSILYVKTLVLDLSIGSVKVSSSGICECHSVT
jgi:hypothetical protein